MLRPGLSTIAQRNADRAPLMRQAQAVAVAQVEASSSAAAVADVVDTAVTGDLTERSPILAQKLRDLDERLQQVEQIQ